MQNIGTEENWANKLADCAARVEVVLRRIEDDYVGHAVNPASLRKSEIIPQFDAHINQTRDAIAKLFETEKTSERLATYTQKEFDDVHEDCRIYILLVQHIAYFWLRHELGHANRILKMYCDDLYDKEIMQGFWDSADENLLWYMRYNRH